MLNQPIGCLALIGNYVPRTCGLATFTRDLHHALQGQAPQAECFVAAVSDGMEASPFPPEVRFVFEEAERDSYRRAADYLNLSGAEAAFLQHEFGIYGGEAGSHILHLLRHLQMPVITTLHTVLEKPSLVQCRVMEEIAERSTKLVVMAERGRELLQETCGIPGEKIEMISHGIPDMPFVDPSFYKDTFGLAGQKVLLTFGLLSPNKGIETVLRALPSIIEKEPNVRYVIVGATHPNLVRNEGERYRESLMALADHLGISQHLCWHNRFVELQELLEFLGAADIYITPYTNRQQITSGTLAYAFGCGKAVLSTPYWHAEELLADGRGMFFPFNDHAALAGRICHLLEHDEERHAMRKRAYMHGRSMIWSQVADAYMKVVDPLKPLTIHLLDVPVSINGKMPKLPEIKLDHLFRMSDDTGIFQHAVYDFPRYGEGYCTDDNARALLLCVQLQELGIESPQLSHAMSRYAAFLAYAGDGQSQVFRNFMLYDRTWLPEKASDDCQGRVMLALGAVVGRSKDTRLRLWAQELFCDTLPAILRCGSPRTWAYALLGIHEYFRRLSGDRDAEDARDILTKRLLDIYDRTAGPNWRWFEDGLSYSNAVLSHALLLSGHWGGDARALQVGLESLEWLQQVQTGHGGIFRPIGSNGFYRRGQPRATFDQQPIEAYITVNACLEAFGATGEDHWRHEAWRSFIWFLGHNDLGQPLFNKLTGGCSDGLHPDRINENEGAESTVVWLLTLANLRLFQREHEVELTGAAARQGATLALANSSNPKETA